MGKGTDLEQINVVEKTYLKNKKIKTLHIYTIMLNKLKLRKMKADIK